MINNKFKYKEIYYQILINIQLFRISRFEGPTIDSFFYNLPIHSHLNLYIGKGIKPEETLIHSFNK